MTGEVKAVVRAKALGYRVETYRQTTGDYWDVRLYWDQPTCNPHGYNRRRDVARAGIGDAITAMLDGWAPTVEWRLAADLSITLHIDGQPSTCVGDSVDVGPLRSRARADRVLELLAAEQARGAAHGVCDRQAEMAANLNGRVTPGHEREWVAPTTLGAGTAVVRSLPGVRYAPWDEATFEMVMPGFKPGYLAPQIVNALWRAFKIGGLYGAQMGER